MAWSADRGSIPGRAGWPATPAPPAMSPAEAVRPPPAGRLRKFACRYRPILVVAPASLWPGSVGTRCSRRQSWATLVENRGWRLNATSPGGRGSLACARRGNQPEQTTNGRLRQFRKPPSGIDAGRPQGLALYVSDVNRAYQFWEAGNIERVEELLERHRPGDSKKDDLRGAAEAGSARASPPDCVAGLIADAHSPVLDLALSPDGRSLAAATSGGALTVWDPDTGALRLHLPDTSDGCVKYTADGGAMISASCFQTPEKGPRAATVRVHAWDASTGKELTARRVNLEVGEVGQHLLAADGTALLGFTSGTKLRVWNLPSGDEVATLDALASDPAIERAMMHLTALSPDRKTLVWQIRA